MSNEDIAIKLTLTPKTVELGVSILSGLQGCEDPFGPRYYYSESFRDLMERLVAMGAAKQE